MRTLLSCILFLCITITYSQNEFITTWKTDNPGVSEDNQITIPTFSEHSYDYSVDWGDGTTDLHISGDITHTYSSPGTYTVKISGVFPSILFGKSEGTIDNNKLITIEQWGNIEWSSFKLAFSRCKNLQIHATDIPNLENVNSLEGAFYKCVNFIGNDSMNSWDISNITDISLMFRDATSFNADIGNWDLSNIEVMEQMFRGASSFNKDIGNWKFPKVTSLGWMFDGATNFNSDLSRWDVSNITSMLYLFQYAEAFNQDISKWNVSSVRSMEYMFRSAKSFNQNITNWDVGSVKSMQSMFSFAISFDQNLGSWNIQNVIALENFFDQINISQENYDATLNGWANQTVIPNNINFNGGSSKFCNSNTSRQLLIDEFSWNITDGGAMCYESVAVKKIILIDATNDQALYTLKNNSHVNLESVPNDFFNFKIESTDNVASVKMELMDEINLVKSANIGDFTFFGQNGNDYLGRNLKTGNYTLMVTPFSGYNLTGTQGATYVLNFKILKGVSRPFITTWKTDMPGTITDSQVIIRTIPGEDYYYDIDWGENAIYQGVSGSVSYNYSEPGTYTIKISGRFPGILEERFIDGGKLVSIEQWGDIDWSTMEGAFSGCRNLDVKATDTPDLSNVKNMARMFRNCSNLIGNENFNLWETKDVVNMTEMFKGSNNFNQNIGNWNVGEVLYMNGMFSDALIFNQPIGNWNVSNVLEMENMFGNAVNFNQPLNDWNVSNLTNAKELFYGALSFNKDIGNWDVGNVINMEGMFAGAKDFNKEIGSWNTSAVTSMNNLFYDANSFNQSISDWEVSNVTNMRAMFHGATNFNQNIGNWDVTNVLDMAYMFERATAFSQNLGNWDLQKAISLENMFDNASISQKDYDLTLNGWASNLNLQRNVKFNAGNSTFCNGEIARKKIIDTYNWQIRDAGKDCPFITTWKTDNPGVSEDNQITIPTFPGETYNYTVDWGDGTIESNFTGDATHTYLNPGTFQVSISGEFPRIYFEGNFGNDSNGDFIVNDIDDNDKILSVDQWGDIKWNSMEAAFYGCSNLDVFAIDTPDLSNVQFMNEMFLFCTSLKGTPSFNNWDLDNVTSLASLFFQADKFNQDIGSWNTSNVTNMNGIFLMASSFNQNINGWDTSNVTNLGTAFHEATSFNQPLNNWDVSAVRQFNSCFGSTNFNQPLNNWNPISAYEMSSMFADNPVFNQNINSWNVSSVTNFSGMFVNATAFDQPLNDWNVSAAEILGGMFSNATSFNQPLNDWDVSSVKEMVNMFAGASKFNQNITSWDTSSVTDISGMFSGAEMFNQNLSIWNVAKVTDMNYMFAYASSFNQDLGGWNVSNVTNMELMFLDTGLSLENYDSTLIGWSNLSSLQNNVNFNASSSQYCESEQARQLIIDTYGWTITDAGKVPFCNEDNDLDGILDHKDSCLDTRPNVIVNDNGCEIIAADAILVYGATPTCPGEANGSISISSALTDYIFNIAVEGPVSTDYNEVSLNENIEVANLTTGLYMVTISIPDISYSQTYGIQINEVGSISGKRESLNTSAKTATYNVKGSYTYIVDINGELKNFSFTSNGKNEIQLSDLSEFNAISITGESDCQGMVTDSFAFSDSVIMFPTITSGEVSIQGYEESSTVLVYDLSGKLVLSKTLSGQGANSIDLQALEAGIYPTVIQTKENSKTFKIIKQ